MRFWVRNGNCLFDAELRYGEPEVRAWIGRCVVCTSCYCYSGSELLEVSSRSLKIVDLAGREQESKSPTPTGAGSSGLGFRVQQENLEGPRIYNDHSRHGPQCNFPGA
ncbi:hypothetical protein BS78_04G228800 [Paspalum vaginatum]|nr:hypothetical protein BS78_04G228800 [Paspalum vaginatum]